MMKPLRQLLLAALSYLLAMPSMSALDLPVKEINGKDYYYYAVKRGDTVLSIARRLGVTRDDLVHYNPSAADFLRQGSTLYLPYDVYKDVQSPAAVDDTPLTGRSAQPFAYKVERGETLFGISHRFGVTPDAIIALNPGVERGLKAGESILIPAGAVVENESVDAAPAPAPAPAAPVAETPAPAPTVNELPPVPGLGDITNDLRPVPGPDFSAVVEANDSVRPLIALALPLDLSGDPQARAARSATEFVKGFMLGLDDERDQWPVDLHILDIADHQSSLADTFDLPVYRDMAAIIVVDNQAGLDAVVRDMRDNDACVLNMLAVQDTAYLTDSRLMQFNTPHNILYAKAAEACMMNYDGYRPVFLVSKGGKGEKAAFTDYLRAQYAEAGIEPLEIAFEGMLSSRELEELDPEESYVFIPGSGALSEFNKFARAIIALREASPDPARIGVYGYPDWTTFRGDALESLHRLGAVIYSRFYAGDSDEDVRRFEHEFREAYGAPSLEQVPSQAMLGYDTARYLMANLRGTYGRFNPEYPEPYHGLQSTFMFVDAESPLDIDGVANGAVYVITFLDGDEVSVQVI